MKGKLIAGEFQANVAFLSDKQYDGLAVKQLIKLVPKNPDRSFLFIVDRTALSHRDQPILVVDLFDKPGRTLRVIPSEMWAVENNLSIANMDFYEFADTVDKEGTFRGFPGG